MPRSRHARGGPAAAVYLARLDNEHHDRDRYRGPQSGKGALATRSSLIPPDLAGMESTQNEPSEGKSPDRKRVWPRVASPEGHQKQKGCRRQKHQRDAQNTVRLGIGLSSDKHEQGHDRANGEGPADHKDMVSARAA